MNWVAYFWLTLMRPVAGAEAMLGGCYAHWAGAMLMGQKLCSLLALRSASPSGTLPSAIIWGEQTEKYGDWIRESVITYIIYLDWQPLTSWLGRKWMIYVMTAGWMREIPSIHYICNYGSSKFLIFDQEFLELLEGEQANSRPALPLLSEIVLV